MRVENTILITMIFASIKWWFSLRFILTADILLVLFRYWNKNIFVSLLCIMFIDIILKTDSLMCLGIFSTCTTVAFIIKAIFYFLTLDIFKKQNSKKIVVIIRYNFYIIFSISSWLFIRLFIFLWKVKTETLFLIFTHITLNNVNYLLNENEKIFLFRL